MYSPAMVKGRIEGPMPTVFLSLSEQELERLQAGEMVEVRGARRVGLGDVRMQLFGNGRLPVGVEPVQS
jgi:hypothetical protein